MNNRRLDPPTPSSRSWASRQHGVLSRSQLTQLGLGRGAIDRRIQQGRLHLLHRGVYAVGHRALTQHGRWMAAALAAGPDARLSHHAAAALWQIRPTARTRVDVTVPRALHARAGLRHHQAVLPPDEVTTHLGIRVTTPARTLFDLAAVLPRHQLERALNEADALRLSSPTSLTQLLERHPARGVATLRPLLLTARRPTRSDLEAAFLHLVDASDLPHPRTNTVIDGKEVDAAWPEQRLLVEVDSYTFHATRGAFENDRRRDRELTVAGWRVLRITWLDLRERHAEVAAQVTALLAAGSSTHPPH
jgi:very-short-patch-repair endonuclease